MVNGEWIMVNREWRMENGEWGEFNGEHKDYHVLLELDEEKNISYQWFDIRDCQFFE